MSTPKKYQTKRGLRFMLHVLLLSISNIVADLVSKLILLVSPDLFSLQKPDNY